MGTAFLLLFTLFCYASSENGVTPIVLWHGMGDSCCFSFSLGHFKEKLEAALPGVYVLSIKIGSNEVEDVENGYLMHPDKQIDLACDIIASDANLKNGFNAIGFSQGSQFLRALVQRCDKVKVKNLISLGGQHQGVYGIPNCSMLSQQICDYLRKLLNNAAYTKWVQKTLVQATYWHDPLNEELYKNQSTFLADINNEINVNLTYVKNLQALENFVMVKFENDTMVEPVESEWFGFYKPGQSVEIETLQESSLFKDDRLGLQKLNDENKLYFLEVEGNHLKFEWSWFEENIITPFLNTTSNK